MTGLPPWEDLVSGADCPFCGVLHSNDFHIKIADMKHSTLLLNSNQAYRGYSVLIFKDRHVTGLEQLTPEEYTGFLADLKDAAQAVLKASNADLMNYASLGNSIPHLHFHIIPRFEGDARWRGPIWMTRKDEGPEVKLDPAGYSEIIQAIRDNLPQ